MIDTLKAIRRIIKETDANISDVENNSQGKMIDNDIIISYKSGAYEKICTEMKKFAKRKKGQWGAPGLILVDHIILYDKYY